MNTAERQLTKKAQIAAASDALIVLLDKPVRVSPTCGISKSKFVAGLQCPKRLYLQVHQPQLAKVTDQFNKDQGTAVEVLARNLFPGGVLVDVDRNHVAQAVRATRELVNNPEVRRFLRPRSDTMVCWCRSMSCAASRSGSSALSKSRAQLR